MPNDAGYWSEEFSLDNFVALVELAAKRANKRAPKVTARYPFLVGEAPGDLPGIDDCRRGSIAARSSWRPPIRLITARATARARRIVRP